MTQPESRSVTREQLAAALAEEGRYIGWDEARYLKQADAIFAALPDSSPQACSHDAKWIEQFTDWVIRANEQRKSEAASDSEPLRAKAREAGHTPLPPDGGALRIIYRASEVIELGNRRFDEGWDAACAALSDSASVCPDHPGVAEPGCPVCDAQFASDSASVDGIDVERLWSVLMGIGVIENGTWVSFQRRDAEVIAEQYAVAVVSPSRKDVAE